MTVQHTGPFEHDPLCYLCMHVYSMLRTFGFSMHASLTLNMYYVDVHVGMLRLFSLESRVARFCLRKNSIPSKLLFFFFFPLDLLCCSVFLLFVLTYCVAYNLLAGVYNRRHIVGW